MPSELLARRPDILQAERQLIAANAQIGAAKALYLPTISLTGALGGANSQLSGLFSGPAHTWSYAGAIAGPIFTAGSVSGQVAQAGAVQQAAVSNYQRVIQAAFGDVSDALVGRRKLVDQTQAEVKLVAALRNYARLAQHQYDGGYVPYSTVLQAEQQLRPFLRPDPRRDAGEPSAGRRPAPPAARSSSRADSIDLALGPVERFVRCSTASPSRESREAELPSPW